MSQLIYFTDNRRVVPFIERAENYFETSTLFTGLEKPFTKSFDNLKFKEDDFVSKINEWKTNKNILLAGDIISHSIMDNNKDDLNNVLQYLLKNYPNNNLYNWLNKNVESKELGIKERIDKNYKKLKYEDKDSLTLVDQAINFLYLSERDEALLNLEKALEINSSNAYIVRNASRIFSLIGENNRSIKVLKDSQYYKYDPQILSAEIAFSQIEKRKTNGIDIGRKLIYESRFKDNEKSELASSLGTFELQEGDFNLAKKFFEISLRKPNANSLAQIVWYQRQLFDLPTRHKKFDSNEIRTNLYFNDGRYTDAFNYSKKWIQEEPYSVRPFRISAHLIGVMLGDNKTASEIYLAGFKTQKNLKGDNFSKTDELSFNNDIAYYLLKSGDIDQAKVYLELAFNILEKKGQLSEKEFVYIATLGLFFFKIKNLEMARKLYKRVIKYFYSENKIYYAGSAFLNYFEEEIIVANDKEKLLELEKELEAIVPENSNSDLLFRKNNLLKNFQKKIDILQ